MIDIKIRDTFIPPNSPNQCLYILREWNLDDLLLIVLLIKIILSKGATASNNYF
jgi:hypothetical protein